MQWCSELKNLPFAFLYCLFPSFPCIFWYWLRLELKLERKAVFSFLLAMDRFAQPSLLSIIRAVNCCFGGLQGGELCYQAVSLFLDFFFTAFWLLMFRQHQLLVLKTFPLEPELWRWRYLIHERRYLQLQGYVSEWQRLWHKCLWQPKGLLSSPAPRDQELGLRAKVVYRHGKNSRRVFGEIESEGEGEQRRMDVKAGSEVLFCPGNFKKFRCESNTQKMEQCFEPWNHNSAISIRDVLNCAGTTQSIWGVDGFCFFLVPGIEVLALAKLLPESKGIYSSTSTPAGPALSGVAACSLDHHAESASDRWVWAVVDLQVQKISGRCSDVRSVSAW